jgi:spermidine synthase
VAVIDSASISIEFESQQEREAASTESTANRFLMPMVFAGGSVSIGLELTMSRLLAPYFGTSTFIWANLIGLTLAFLALGYFLGGKVADRRPSSSLLYVFTAIAGFTVGIIPLLARPILRSSLDAFDDVDVGAFYGSLVGALLLLALPTTLLGFITPFAIRLRSRDIRLSGETAGKVYALSTVGSITGSFIPVILLIPVVGTRNTFLIMAIGIIVLSACGLLHNGSRAMLFICVALVPALAVLNSMQAAVSIKTPKQGVLVAEAESEYNYIQVVNDDGRVLLSLNEGHAVHSIYDPQSVLTGGPWDYFLLGPLFSSNGSNPRRALIIGLAGGTSARSLLAAYPGLQVDGVEIDPEILRMARKYFGLDDVRVKVITEDGRYFLRTSMKTYDLISLDAYRQPYIPFHLTTREFFEETLDHLSSDGVVVVNAGRTDTDFRLVNALASTMKAVFPAVWLVDVAGYDNTMIFASRTPTQPDKVRERFELRAMGGIVQAMATEAWHSGDIRLAAAHEKPYTDDLAPVEYLIDRMIIDAAREDSSR